MEKAAYQIRRKMSLPLHTRIWLDQDPGGDDAVCLFQCLFDPNIEVNGLTVTAGNVDVDKCQRNAQVLLSQYNRTDVPLYVGARTHLYKFDVQDNDIDGWHGAEGLPVSMINAVPKENYVKEKGEGIGAIYKAIMDQVDKVTYVITGPCTTFALLIEKGL